MNASGSVTTAISGRLDGVEIELRRECTRTVDEIEALNAVADSIRLIEPTIPSGVRTDRMVDREVVAGPSAVGDGLDRVRDDYETTVMSVPHYAEESGDTYSRSFEEEFGPDLAAALTEGMRFHEWCKQAVLSAIEKSQSAANRSWSRSTPSECRWRMWRTRSRRSLRNSGSCRRCRSEPPRSGRSTRTASARRPRRKV